MSGVTSLVRPAIRKLKAYASARSVVTSGSVLLDANESPWPLLESDAFERVNRYPEPQPRKIVESAAALYGAPADSIVVTRGTDEGIELLTRTVCDAGRDRVLVCPPTYGVYETAAAIQGCGVVRVPLVGSPDFRLDRKGIVAALRDRKKSVKLVYVCTPNNPTGTVISTAAVAALCRAAAGRALVVADEAYLEFSTRPSVAAKIARYPNLVVLRTLSKAWGLAGVRCGFLIADPALAAILQRVRAPYPVSSASVQVVERVFNRAGEKTMKRSVARILREKRRLRSALSRFGYVFPGEANFLLLRVADTTKVLTAARQAGLILRDRSFDYGLAGCIRVTVGTARENDATIACFKEAERR